MSDPIAVDIELAGRTVHAANVYPPKRPAGPFMLRYTDEYRANPDAYPFAPQIPLTGGLFAGAAGLPGPMQDGAPDRWTSTRKAWQRTRVPGPSSSITARRPPWWAAIPHATRPGAG